MTIAAAVDALLGADRSRKVRYAIVALGDISQEALMPGVKHTGNSEMTAFVTDDAGKARLLGERYGVSRTYRYDEFDVMLRSGEVDAIYLATPNWRHAEFAIPALEAGIHVLAEKPLEVSTERCRAINAAAARSGAKLMVAYRLHFEPGTLRAVERIRAGELGEVTLFTSTFVQMIDPANHRARNGVLAGPVFDMGPYTVNAARYVFGAEPEAVVSAVAVRHPEAGLGDVDDTVAVTLRFPGNRLAQFVLGYYGNVVQSYTVVGTKGSLHADPGYMYGMAFEHQVTIGEKKSRDSFPNTDHFGGELQYFSECILDGRDPEPDGEEGYADVRVLEGIARALESGTSVVLEPFERSKRIDPATQRRELRAVKPPELVGASNPGKDMDKAPRN
ncbi:MAG: Gfo/Idh/MocA family oxidoreductase [Gluconacetobacter diazotrophicus]|nr:Gfo/Idh/MocA family oxidoreductase [Gluconacetobacter diazotrophicus]